MIGKHYENTQRAVGNWPDPCPHGDHPTHSDRANGCLGSQYDSVEIAEWREGLANFVAWLRCWLGMR